MKVVSANYRNRNSAYPWLVRDEHEPISAARAFKKVVASGVIFKSSNKDEEGFGCRVVAYCEHAVGEEREASEFKLRFNGADFVDEKGNEVPSCKSLILGSDRSMVATV